MWSRNKINSVFATIYFISAPHVRTALTTESLVIVIVPLTRRVLLRYVFPKCTIVCISGSFMVCEITLMILAVFMPGHSMY